MQLLNRADHEDTESGKRKEAENRCSTGKFDGNVARIRDSLCKFSKFHRQIGMQNTEQTTTGPEAHCTQITPTLPMQK